MKRKDLLPLKAVVDELGVSRWTLWRAARSNLPGFPPPTVMGRRIFWRKAEIETLEAALMQFQGRCAFDNKRRHDKVLKVAKQSKARTRKDQRTRPTTQQDLFS
ncbi:MAG: hypothetical protein NW206_08330 [Hyphomonadaceae bacterium]|nr:hypothetical protein [Hyphomonadaceae bacterium]